MKNAPSSPSPDAQLAEFRRRIDALDDQLTALILERTGIVKQVAALKSAHWPNDCHIRSGREGRMHRQIAERFAGSAFAVPAALTIWRQMIAASTHVESPLSVSLLARAAHHATLAREYFGAQAPQQLHASVDDALAAMQQQRSNLLILPAPSNDNLAEWAQVAAQAPQLKIFASLPITPAFLLPGQTPALALAAIDPEPSDDDVTYVLFEGAHLPSTLAGNPTVIQEYTHAMLVYDGFLPADADILRDLPGNATWLGAHPRPLAI